MRARSRLLLTAAVMALAACSSSTDNSSGSGASSSGGGSNSQSGNGNGSNSGSHGSSGHSSGSVGATSNQQTSGSSANNNGSSNNGHSNSSVTSDSTAMSSAHSTSSSTSSSMMSSSHAGSSSSMASSSSGADPCTSSGGSQTGGTQVCSNTTANVANTNYSYELWSNGVGSGCMTVFGKDATFKANWSGAGDFLARVGLSFDETKTPSQLGTIGTDFAETQSGTAAYSFIGIYGWSVNPLHEYYIVEDWFGSHPTVNSLGSGATQVGTITVDGGKYDVYTHTQNNQPSITGTATFVQFFSIRQTARQCGHISISDHFSQWAGLGMQLGKMEEARILVEAGGNASGQIDFTTATMTVQ
jgi:hypothetical protein